MSTIHIPPPNITGFEQIPLGINWLIQRMQELESTVSLGNKIQDATIPQYEYLTRKEVASRLKVSLVTLDAYVKEGLIKAHRLGGIVRYKIADVDAAFELIKSAKL